MTTRKGMLSNQPQLTRITPTAIQGSWVLQPIEGMTSLRTDFEKHAMASINGVHQWRPLIDAINDSINGIH
jgi:hypothetical protein